MNLSEAAEALAQIERDVVAAVRAAHQLAQRGALPPTLCRALVTGQWALYFLQKQLRATLREVLASAPGGVALASRIPKPVKPTAWCDVRGALGAAGLEGLGAVPVVVVVAGAAVSLGVAAAAAWAVTRAAQVGGETAQRIVALREYTRQLRQATEEAARRYNECLRAGRPPAECAGQAPVPAPQAPPAVEQAAQEAQASPLLWGLGGIGALVVLGLLGWWWIKARERGALDGLESLEGGGAPEPLPAGSSLRGLGRYMLEVDKD